MNDDNSPIKIEVPAQPIATPARKQWVDENKYRIMDALTYQGKTWEDVGFSAINFLCFPMFLSSVLTSTTGWITSVVLLVLSIIILVILAVSNWIIIQVPEAAPLVLVRLLIIAIGLILGAV